MAQELASSHVSQHEIIVNERTQSIYFNADINSNTTSKLIQKLLEMESAIIKSEKKLKRKFEEMVEPEGDCKFDVKISPKPIKLYITTHGGFIHNAFSVIDIIDGMDVDVYTICTGSVASAGTLISLAGKQRYITKNSYMLIHELRGCMWGTFKQMSEYHENSTKLMTHMKDFYLKHTKLSLKELDEQLKKDIYWDADQCLKKGLVDEIL